MNRTRYSKPRRSARRPIQRSHRSRASHSSHSRRATAPRFRIRWVLLLLFAIPTLIYIFSLDATVRKQFEGKRWALPASVYAKPVDLYTGMQLSPEFFHTELKAIGYRQTTSLNEPSQFKRKHNDFYINTRSFTLGDGHEPARSVRIRFKNNEIQNISDLRTNRRMALMRLEPRLIGKIYPTHYEDREIVQLEEVPRTLIDALIVTEDRKFFEHNGISARGIIRAFVANFKSGGFVQGGSTITQQLVKNLFLTSERTLKRKFNEALMALLLEWHYSKEEILEAYLNEVFLGQDGNRAIHGVGMAAKFYFNRPINELKLHESALLVALVRAASSYNPRKNPKAALERRNLVLNLMKIHNKADPQTIALAQSQPLDVSNMTEASQASKSSPYPAFLDMVRTQLHQDYREEDLRSEGLRIFTTLDMPLQRHAERTMEKGLKELERKDRRIKKLQGAMVVTRSQTGEVLALVNGKNSSYAGFNRPLNAVRQIGSLVKVAVYLTALENTKRYSLTTFLNDEPYEWVDKRTGEKWTPKNYDYRNHGKVGLYKALANSYNLATVHLGMSLGLDSIRETMYRMGIKRDFKMYPSTLLGSVALSPVEVAQMYQTIASGGYRVPLRAIQEVLTYDGLPLQRYELSVEKRFDSAPIYLLNYAMQQVIKRGTGKKYANSLPDDMVLAGKTGTSNNLRDSWFAGFGMDYSTVTWLGRDDNKPIYLSGGSGAMYVWTKFMKTLNVNTSHPVTPTQIAWKWVDYKSGKRSRAGRKGAVKMPYVAKSHPVAKANNNFFQF